MQLFHLMNGLKVTTFSHIFKFWVLLAFIKVFIHSTETYGAEKPIRSLFLSVAWIYAIVR